MVPWNLAVTFNTHHFWEAKVSQQSSYTILAHTESTLKEQEQDSILGNELSGILEDLSSLATHLISQIIFMNLFTIRQLLLGLFLQMMCLHVPRQLTLKCVNSILDYPLDAASKVCGKITPRLPTNPISISDYVRLVAYETFSCLSAIAIPISVVRLPSNPWLPIAGSQFQYLWWGFPQILQEPQWE